MTPADDAAVERPDTEGAAGRLRHKMPNITVRDSAGQPIENWIAVEKADLDAVLAARDSLLARVREQEHRLEIDRVWAFDEAGNKVEVPVPAAARDAVPDGIDC